MASNSTNWFSA